MSSNPQDQNHTEFICHGCIGDEYLANEIEEEGVPKQCSCCGETRKAISFCQLADRLHEVFQKHFELTPCEPEGIDYTRLLQKPRQNLRVRRGA